MDYSSLMQLPGIGQIICHAINEGKDWGRTFLRDGNWYGDRNRMSSHAIYESTMWSVGNGLWSGLLGFAGIPSDIAISLYSQVKLASTLFTIHGIDISLPQNHVLVLAAAAGVGLAELANYLGTSVATKAVERALMSVPGKVFAEINKVLGIKIISKAGETTFMNISKLIPGVNSVINGCVNGATMNATGHSILAFIREWR